MTRNWSGRTRALVVGGITLFIVLIVLLASRSRHASSAVTAADDMAGMPGMTKTPGTNSGTSDVAAHLTASQLTTFGVTFGTAEQRTLADEVRTVGTVMLDEARIATVAPKFNGFVERLYVNTTGQSVRRGEPLAAVFSPDLLAAEEELLLARRLDHTVGQSTVPGVPSSSGELLAAARRRLRLWDVSERQIDDVLHTGKASRTVTLYSPVSGVVTDKKVTVGQAVQTGMELYMVADLSDVWVDVQLRESDAAAVRIGSSADIEFRTYPDRPYKGRVTFIYPTLAEQTRTVRARVAVANPDGRLKPGMYATVRMTSPSRIALTVSRSAVVETGERTVVFVDEGHGSLKPVNVKLGHAAGDYVEVLSGLAPGQRVVTSAQFLLDSESNLAEVMKSMLGTGGEMKGMSAAQNMSGMPGMTNASEGHGTDTRGVEMKGADMRGMDMKGADTRGMAGAASPAATPDRVVSPKKTPR